MKKVFVLVAVVFAAFTLSAQEVNTSMIDFGKSQYSGYLLNLKNASVDLVESTMRNLMENQYNLKASKENGYRAYLSQPFAPFGPDNYDIYFNVSEFGKKKNKTTQLAMIVTTGNMNAITSANNPDADNAIRYVLKSFAPKVSAYEVQQQINALKEQLAKLESNKKSLQKDQDKNAKQIEKIQKTMEANEKSLKETDAQINKIEQEIKELERQLKH